MQFILTIHLRSLCYLHYLSTLQTRILSEYVSNNYNNLNNYAECCCVFNTSVVHNSWNMYLRMFRNKSNSMCEDVQLIHHHSSKVRLLRGVLHRSNSLCLLPSDKHLRCWFNNFNFADILAIWDTFSSRWLLLVPHSFLFRIFNWILNE